MNTKNEKRVPEKISPLNVKKEKGYLYYIDKDGDVARVPAKWNENPEFLPKEKSPILVNYPSTPSFNQTSPSQTIIQTNINTQNNTQETHINYPPENNKTPQAIPVTNPGVPERFKDNIIFYYDKAVVETIGDNALSQAHLKLYPITKNIINTIPEDEFIHNATIASFSASILYELLKAHGTNIIFNELNNTLQTSIIPRFESDGLNLFWTPTRGDQTEIQNIANLIKSKLVIGEIKDTTKINLDKELPAQSPVQKPKVNIVDRKVNYMIEHLRRDR